jgi:rhodanese-related sulfurtransferase
VAPAVDKSVLIDKIRQSDLFKDLPPDNLEEMFSRMETVKVKSGETIIREGEEGDYYYLLASGAATVTRRVGASENPQVVAELSEPTGFGEEALISKAKRNATITMTSAGAVMRLSKDAFDEYVKEPLVTWISPKEAQDKVGAGAQWIDVREGEHEKHLHGALSIPLSQIRERSSELKNDASYICYCDNGRQSSTAAFLLRQRGLNVGVLRGGVQALTRAGLA